MIPNCPNCGTKLIRVTQSPHSMLNADQFDAVKAGDWYCDNCPGNGRGKLDLCYFWNYEAFNESPGNRQPGA